MMEITPNTTRVMTPLGIGTVTNRVVSPLNEPETRIWLVRFDSRDFGPSEYPRTFPQGGNCRFRSFLESDLSEVGGVSTESHPQGQSIIDLGSGWESIKTGKKFVLKVITPQGICKLGLQGSSDYYEVHIKNLESRYKRVQ